MAGVKKLPQVVESIEQIDGQWYRVLRRADDNTEISRAANQGALVIAPTGYEPPAEVVALVNKETLTAQESNDLLQAVAARVFGIVRG